MIKINMLNNYTPIQRKAISDLKKDARLYNLSDIELQILYNRGICTADEIDAFLYNNVNHLEPSMEMRDCDKFCEVLENGIRDNQNIVCYTDYDVDGITAGLICLEGVQKIIAALNSNSTINLYSNNRFVEGYGITVNGVKDLMQKYPDTKIIITTDNGIVGYAGIDYAKSIGLTVLVTDHHAPGDIIPDADAVVDVHRPGDNYPFKNLCGAGVIFKLLLQLAWNTGCDLEDFYSMLDLVAMGTIGDMMPLLGENRIMVREGLKLVRKEQRLAFRILRQGVEEYNKVQGKEKSIIVDEDLFGFLYCPMLNALGRLEGSIDKAIELFTETDEKKMLALVKYIIENNETRKEITTTQTDDAIEKVEAMSNIPDVIVIHDKNYDEGIVGLIAGRLKELYNRPAFVFTTAEKEENGQNITVYKGSARSIDSVNLIELLRKEKQYLLGFGGHKAAGGVTIDPSKLDDFIKAINTDAQLTKEQKTKKIDVDAAFRVDEISEDLIDRIDNLKPYGMAFPKPRFGLSDFVADQTYTGSPYRGSDGKTVRLVDRNKFTVIMFKNPEAFAKIEHKYQSGQVIKAIGMPAANLFNNNISLQFQVEDGYMF